MCDLYGMYLDLLGQKRCGIVSFRSLLMNQESCNELTGNFDFHPLVDRQEETV